MVTSPASFPAEPAVFQPKISKEEKRRRCFEVFLVLAISLGIILLNSFYLLKNAPAVPLRMSALRSFYGMAHESLSLLLLAYVLSRRNLRFRDIGLQWSKRDIVPTFVVTALAALGYVAGGVILQALHYKLYGTIVRGPGGSQFFSNPSLWALPFILLNPFFEELIVRAYLMTEIKELTGSNLIAIVFSVLLQASYHLYYGWMGALIVAFPFIVFATYYARTNRAVPIIMAHAVFDVYGLIALMKI